MRKHITTDESKVLKQLSGLAVGEEELCERAEMLNGLLTILDGIVLIGEGSVVGESTLCVLYGTIAELLRRGVVDELLENFVGVLFCELSAACGEDGADVIDELLALWTKSVDIDGGVFDKVLESLVDLGVVWHSPSAEGLDHTVKTHLRGAVRYRS